ncbi:chalcone isomerase family protein [Polaromonas sp.]|uniref:chalcone isomerase family protein n=1 Tax=Polaromonas sp. TaxID=1869339 RepID=UPI0032636DFE
MSFFKIPPLAHVAVLTLLLAGNAIAAVTSTKFEPTQAVQDTTLTLNGAGTRYRAIFKVYDLALYTPRKVTSAEELLALPGPKRLNFVALRDVPGTDLGLAFIKGLSANSSPELALKHTVSSTRLVEIFSGRSKLTAGDSFAMEYVPGKGTTFYILGQPQGAPVGDAEFFNMVLRIWVGPSPADLKLKDALLGQ